jgi:hypothetical protein
VQQDAEVVRVDADPALPLQPGRQLRRRPRPPPGIQQRLQRVEVRRGHRRRAAGARAVGQGVEAVGQERLDVLADRLLVRAEVAGDAGDAPARVGQPDHLQAVAGTRGDARLAGAGAQFVVLGGGQRDTDHGGVPPRPPFYDLVTSTCLE